MAIYRFAPINSDAFIDTTREFVCDSDAEAMSLARTMAMADATVEVWDNTRFVGFVSVQSDARAVALTAIVSAIPAVVPSALKADAGQASVGIR